MAELLNYLRQHPWMSALVALALLGVLAAMYCPRFRGMLGIIDADDQLRRANTSVAGQSVLLQGGGGGGAILMGQTMVEPVSLGATAGTGAVGVQQQEAFSGGSSSSADPTASASASAGAGGISHTSFLPSLEDKTLGNLLPIDKNMAWSAGGSAGADLAGNVIPAELMDPTRQPVFASMSKTRNPNLQLRPDPPVDRSQAAGQLFSQPVDGVDDDYRSQGVDIRAVYPTK